MVGKDAEIERIARDMINTHGWRAARVAVERLNEMIDRNDARGRDIWACIVHLIHERQGSGPVWTPGVSEELGRGTRLDCAPQLGAAMHV